MKYPMNTKTDRPLFEYIVLQNGKENYFLFDDFDSALKKAIDLSIPNKIGLVFELAFNNETREFRAKNTFTVCDGRIKYDKYARIGLHVHFYVNAGYWLNPNEEWLAILDKRRESK